MKTSIKFKRAWRFFSAAVASIGAIGLSTELSTSCHADPVAAPVHTKIPSVSFERVNDAPTVTTVDAGNGMIAVHIQGDVHTEAVRIAPGVYSAHTVPTVHFVSWNWFVGWIQGIAQNVLSWFRWIYHSCWSLVHAFGNWFAANFHVSVGYTDTTSSSATCITFIDIPVVCKLQANTNGQVNLNVTSR